MAKRFKFRLEAVLTVRKRLEDEQRRVVAGCLRTRRDRQAAQNRLQILAEKNVEQSRKTRGQSRLDVATAVQEQRWRVHLFRAMQSLRQEIESMEVRLVRERAELARRSRDHKAIEKLRERRLAEHATAQSRVERVEYDDFASQMYIRETLTADSWTPVRT